MSKVEIKDYTPEIIAKIEQATKRGLTAGALFVQARASENSAVDTGRMRASISYTVDGGGVQSPNPPSTDLKNPTQDTDYLIPSESNSAIVGTNVEYAPYVEYGTSRMNAQPFLEPALINNRSKIIKIFESEYEKGLK